MEKTLSKINPSQRQAVIHKGSHLLIVAGPGTGKTHTLTRRIAHIIPELSDTQKILAITFTNKSAKEMRERLVHQLSCPLDKMFIGTFHSFCLFLLREYIDRTSLPRDFSVGQPEEIQTLVKGLWPDLSKKERRDLLDQISQWKAAAFDTPEIESVQRYNAFLRTNNVLDYDDLLVETVRLLTANPDLVRSLRKTHPYVCVDEYQDINLSQNALLKLLAAKNVLLTAIGDPNQAIYGFRGSDVLFFERFHKDYPGAKTLTLTENYRSGQNIVEASSQVISRSDFEVPSLVAQIYEHGRLTIYHASTDKAEAEYVVHAIERMVGGTTMFSRDSGRVDSGDDADRSFGDIAVLYRLNIQRKALEQAFDRSGIPYQVSGEEAHITEYAQELGAEKVSLLTIHAAKGLEFPVVFIIGCEESLLPLDLEGMKGQEAEERRLFYVGMTRAKEALYLTGAQRRVIFGTTRQTRPSPFLKDIEDRLKEYEQQRKAPARTRLKGTTQIELF